MTEPSAHPTEPDRPAVRSTPTTSTVAPAVLRPRSIGVTPCPACGTRLDAQAIVCPECGERLRQEPRLIRCLYCGASASSELSICPSCCRELRAAPSPMLSWGMPVALVLLFMMVLAARWDDINPLAWARDRLSSGVALVETIGGNFEPELVIVMTPVPGNRAGNLAVALAPAASVQPAQAVANTEKVVDPEPTEVPTAVLSTVADEMAALGVGGVQAIATEEAALTEPAPVEAFQATQGQPAPVEVVAQSGAPEAAEATVTPEPATPEPATPTTVTTATPTPPTATAVVGGLAAMTTVQSPTPTWTPLATVAPEATPVHLLALLPTPTPGNAPRGPATGQVARGTLGDTTIAGALPTPTATVTPVVYQVRSGDTLVVIARRYSVSVEELMAANSIGARDVTRIMPGRMLVIPVPTPTPLPSATPSPIRLAAPVPLSPAVGAQLDCLREERLQWERVQYIKDSDKYLLHLGFVSGYGADGGEQITWVVAQQRPVTMVEWTLDPALCSLAPQAYGRQWRWWVEVVADMEGVLTPVSPPSPLWGFAWN